MSRYDPFPTNYRVEFTGFGPGLRPKPPTPNRPGILASQVCWIPDSAFLFYYWGRKTFIYRPAARTWDTITTDTGGGYLHTPPGSCMGSLCWDPINREVVLFGGGYHGISGKSFDIGFDPRATWVFGFSTREWRRLDLGPAVFNTVRPVLDSFRNAGARVWADAGQHYMGHADLFPANTPLSLAARINELGTRISSYSGTLAQGGGYVRQQLDSAASCLNRAAAFLAQAEAEVTAGNFQGAYLSSLDSAKWILTRAVEHAQVSPPPRYYSRMVYAGNGKIVLFGGTGDKETYCDTWVYDCAARMWENRHPSVHPSGRACFDFDAKNNVCAAIDNGLSLWTYDPALNEWKKWAVTLPFVKWDNWNPGVMYMDYDSLHDCHVLTACEQAYGGPARRNTYTLAFDKTTAPAASAAGGPDYAFFGSYWNAFRQTQPPDTAAWRRFLDTLPVNTLVNAVGFLPFKPDERAYGTGTYDFERDQLILWGGGHSAYMGAEVSQFDLSTGRWYQSCPESYPPYPFGNPDGDGWSTLNGEPGSAHSYTHLGYDMRLKMMMLAGYRYFDCDVREWMVSAHYANLGSQGGSVTTWNPKWGMLCLKGYHYTSPSLYMTYLDTATHAWAQLGPSFPASVTGTTEESRACHDSRRDRVFYYGIGTDGNTRTNETWAFNLADSSWEKLEPAMFDSAGAALPDSLLPSKGSYQIWYDPDHDWVFMFGAQLYPAHSTIYGYNCAENYWRILGHVRSGSQVKNVGYSLKRKMFVTAFIEQSWDPYHIGVALYKFNPSLLPPLQSTSFKTRGPGLQDGLSCSPNPFNPALLVRFTLRDDAPVTLSVHCADGRLVRTLWSGATGKGSHSVAWDGRDGRNHPLSSGVYYLAMATPRFSKRMAVTLMK